MKAPRVAWVAEPPAAYIVRPSIVVDCSVLVAVLFNESLADSARAKISSCNLHAPYLLDHEIASVALKKLRSGMNAEVVSSAVEMYGRYDIELHRVSPPEALPLADAHGLSPYDAAYLALAAALRVPLVTFDDKLGKVAMRHLRSLE